MKGMRALMATRKCWYPVETKIDEMITDPTEILMDASLALGTTSQEMLMNVETITNEMGTTYIILERFLLASLR